MNNLARLVAGGVAALWLTACAGLHARGSAGPQPAVDRILLSGDIQVAQEHLRTFGFDPGPTNGVYTPQTQAAVRAFQANYGLPITGLLDRRTRQELLPGLEQGGVMR